MDRYPPVAGHGPVGDLQTAVLPDGAHDADERR